MLHDFQTSGLLPEAKLHIMTSKNYFFYAFIQSDYLYNEVTHLSLHNEEQKLNF